MLASNMWKSALFLLLVLSLHESAHMLAAKAFHYEVPQVVLYPFGFGASILHLGHGSLWRETLILLAGPCVHLIIPFLLIVLVKFDLISITYANYLEQLNQSVLLFNLLPIYPLDGGRILLNFLHLFLPYCCGLWVSYALSVSLVLYLFHETAVFSFQIVLLFLLFQQLLSWLFIKREKEQFYYYRYLSAPKRIRLKHPFQDCFRAFYNVIRFEKEWMQEKAWIRRYFEKEDLKKRKQSHQIML